MTVAYFQPSFESAYLGAKLANLSSDTLKVGLIASGTLAVRATSETYVTVADLLANNGSALTEVSTIGTNYTRLTLAGVSYTKSALVVTLTATSPTWANGTFSAVYGWLHDDSTGGSDATRALICIWDFAGTQSVTATNFTLTVQPGGITTWTAAQ